LEEDKEKKKKRWREEEAEQWSVWLSGGWWLGGAGALLYPISIGFCTGSKPGQKKKKISGCVTGLRSAHVQF
jgi:hypothetical protein